MFPYKSDACRIYSSFREFIHYAVTLFAWYKTSRIALSNFLAATSKIHPDKFEKPEISVCGMEKIVTLLLMINWISKLCEIPHWLHEPKSDPTPTKIGQDCGFGEI